MHPFPSVCVSFSFRSSVAFALAYSGVGLGEGEKGLLPNPVGPTPHIAKSRAWCNPVKPHPPTTRAAAGISLSLRARSIHVTRKPTLGSGREGAGVRGKRDTTKGLVPLCMQAPKKARCECPARKKHHFSAPPCRAEHTKTQRGAEQTKVTARGRTADCARPIDHVSAERRRKRQALACPINGLRPTPATARKQPQCSCTPTQTRGDFAEFFPAALLCVTRTPPISSHFFAPTSQVAHCECTFLCLVYWGRVGTNGRKCTPTIQARWSFHALAPPAPGLAQGLPRPFCNPRPARLDTISSS